MNFIDLENRLEIISIIVVIVCAFFMGWFGNQVYKNWNYTKEVGGIWTYADDKMDAIRQAQDLDSGGNFVCINIRDTTPKEAVEVCKHEVGHEIFSQYCEKNIDKCLKVVK